ncbi:MAG: FecR domain-containing protein [Gemmatimonadetes bacterium]|nr:FecR domain-containing protein [Gemmatimonadota bacterium]
MERIREKAGRRPSGRLAVAVVAGAGLGAGASSAQEPPPPDAPIDYDAAIAQTGIDGSYGYVRALDGSARLIQTGSNERIDVRINEPVLVGDRVFLSGGSRAELVLADRNLVRLGDDAELGFRALANSGDTSDPASVLELTRGTMHLVVSRDQLARDYPSVVTPNASVQPRGPGSFLIVVDDDRRTEVVAREGSARVDTQDEAAEVRAGESLFIEGSRGQNLEFASAPSLDRLERWGAGLSDYAQGEYTEYVDSNLHYAASSLRGHGSWVHYGGRYAWRPHVSVGWSPYRHGRWRYTPSGLFWVSYEPWGWVPYHYGYWDYHDHHGWLWYPGYRFATAHVYWYWGPRYSGWIPTGYYWRHYGNYYGHRLGFHYGVYGYIGGGFGAYRHWTFLPHGRLGHRRQHFYSVGGSDLGRRRTALGRGVLFTDTRSLRPDAWRRPNETLAGLRRIGARDGRALPNAQPFVERARLPQTLERVTLTGRDARAGSRAVRAGQRDIESRRLQPTTRRVEGRTPTLDRGARTRDTGLRTPDATRRGSELSRPTTRSRETGGELRRPTRRPTVDAGATSRRPVARPPTTRSNDGRALRRPERPVARDAGNTRQVRPTTRGSSRPTVRRSNPSSSRPTVRRGGGSSSRPTARAQRSGSSRLNVQRSSPNSSRPAVRRGSSGSRPTVNRSSGSRSGPSVRRSGSGGSRPSVSRGSSGRGGSARSGSRSRRGG